MERARYRALSQALEERLSARPEVLGLIFLGSTAEKGRLPDAASDHDFFVVTEASQAERLRTELSWVPEQERLVFVHRETAHGLKLLYDDGHVMELAVFSPQDLVWARGEPWRVVFSRGLDLEGILRHNAAHPPAPSDPAWLVRQALFQIVIGVLRFGRGERLAGHKIVLGEALPRLTEALARATPPTGPEASGPAIGGGNPPAGAISASDPLDPLRRFEQIRPALGARLGRVLTMPVDQAGAELLRLIEEELSATPLAVPPRALAAARAALAAVRLSP